MIDGVDKSDTQKINTVKYGTLVAAEPCLLYTSPSPRD